VPPPHAVSTVSRVAKATINRLFNFTDICLWVTTVEAASLKQGLLVVADDRYGTPINSSTHDARGAPLHSTAK
jgi:hypothetical protein